MKRIVGLALVAALLLALPVAEMASAKGAKATAKVDICHFPGHVSPVTGNSDWKITGMGLACIAQGGKILSVACKGAENGHGIARACGGEPV